VRKHLAEMNPTQATTLFLHDGLGHNLSEIALMTGVSVAAAQSRLVRGRRELGRRLEQPRLTSGGPNERRRLSQRATQALQPFRHLGTPVEEEAVATARRTSWCR
jgi:hypothetical protein